MQPNLSRQRRDRKKRCDDKNTRNATTTHLMRNTIRGIIRTHSVCWLNSSCQFLNVIPWINEFVQYSKTANNVFSITFNILNELKMNTNQEISAATVNKVAHEISKYINITQQKDISFNTRFKRPMWNILREQDASEFIRYFFNMVVNLQNYDSIPDALFSPSKPFQLIHAMQRFIRTNFVFSTSKHVECTQTNHSHVIRTEDHIMLDLDLDANEESATLQYLFDTFNVKQIMKDINCEHCSQRHDDFHYNEFSDLRNCNFMLIYFKRFRNGLMEKKMNMVDCNEPIVIQTSHGLVAYKAEAALNHHGTSISHGHYTTDKYFNDQIYNCDDKSKTKI